MKEVVTVIINCMFISVSICGEKNSYLKIQTGSSMLFINFCHQQQKKYKYLLIVVINNKRNIIKHFYEIGSVVMY